MKTDGVCSRCYRASSMRARLMLDFFEIVRMRKCLLGIRQRAAGGGA